jgi:hypothetical protein
VQEEQTLILPVSALPSCKFMQPHAMKGVSLLSLDALTDFHHRQISSVMDHSGTNYIEKPITAESVLTSLSFAAYRNHAPVGCVCLSAGAEENTLELSVFFLTEHTPEVLMNLLRCASEAVLKNGVTTGSIRIPVVTESAGKLVQALTGKSIALSERLVSASLEL